jgi:hypothetical protein
MPKICYVPKKFTKAHSKIIETANRFLQDYADAGYSVTLRSLYYRFVASGLIPNDQREYNRLGAIIADARLAGRIDWAHLIDRTRNLADLEHYTGPQDALDKLASWYHVDMWANQAYRPEVWIEKDALVGVIQRVCQENDVPYFSCRGYTSLSEMWAASMRLTRHINTGYIPYIIHFGDHDPSGIDMSRDIYDRLHTTFMTGIDFERVALTMEQVEEYAPPPNPAKVTDSRYKAYVEKYGDESWELDALEPPKFRELIESSLAKMRDEAQWAIDVQEKAKVVEQLQGIAKDWESIGSNKRALAKAQKELQAAQAELAKLRASKKPVKKRKPKK